MSETKRCPQCQAEIPVGAPEGLCPQCLLQAGLEPKTAEAAPQTAAYSPSQSGFVPPTPAELQPAFPQLEILELLGKGGMGAVYKARQPGLDRLVAVKILPPEVSRDPAFAERFSREARALAMLNHPNIVGVYDSGHAGGYYYFVMEYLDGVNLRQAMRAGQLRAAEALKIVPQICDALQFAHDEGIVHRDIKPENILLDKKGRVKIADFGLAKLLGKTAPDFSLTGTQQVMGTMHYMAPEQLEGSRDVDHRADIYSLGVTFYEMLTGELPIGRFAAPSKKVQIDVRLDEVVLRSLEKEPELRYQHASEIKTEVETIAQDRPELVGSVEAPLASKPPRPWLVRFLGALLVVACVYGLLHNTWDFLVPAEVPAGIANDERLYQFYDVFRNVNAGANYLLTLAGIASGVGLFLFLPWGRRTAVWLTLIWLVYGVMTVPVDFAVEFHSIKFGEAQEVNAFVGKQDPVAQVKELILFSVLGTIVGLMVNIAWLVYLTRPHVVAAFEGSNPPPPAAAPPHADRRPLQREAKDRRQQASETKTEPKSIVPINPPEPTGQAPAPAADGGIPVSFYFKTMGLAALAWLLVPLLWNAREWGLAILCLTVGAFIVWRARGVMQFFPASTERWRQRSWIYRRVNIIVAVLMAAAGVYFVFLAGYQTWERCQWNSQASTRDEFQQVYRGGEHHLVAAHLPEFDKKDIPRAELGMAAVPRTIGWNLSISNPPILDLFATYTICVSLFVGVLIITLVYVGFMDAGSTWSWQFGWIWPTLGLGLATLAPVAPYAILLIIFSPPAGYTYIETPMLVNDDLPAVAARVDDWARENGYVTGDSAAGEIYLVPGGRKIAAVETRHLWRPNVFDRWEMTVGGLKSKAPDFAPILVGSARAKQSVVLPERRLFDPTQPAMLR